MGGVPFSGGSPQEEWLARAEIPVMGHYGGDDERVNATVPRAEEALDGGSWAKIYDGAGHGFLRRHTGRDGANQHVSVQAWPMTFGSFRAAAFYGSDG